MNTQIKEALDRAGGVAAVAAHFAISPVSVYEWIKRGLVPAERCPEIEKLSGGTARCEELNGSVDWGYLRAQVGPSNRRATDAEPDADPGRAGRAPPSRDNILTFGGTSPLGAERKP